MYCIYTSTSSFNWNCGFNLKLRLTGLKQKMIILFANLYFQSLLN